MDGLQKAWKTDASQKRVMEVMEFEIEDS